MCYMFYTKHEACEHNNGKLTMTSVLNRQQKALDYASKLNYFELQFIE